MKWEEDLQMSAKCLDQQGRWRNKVVAFRMSPEEDELLETAVRLSGLTKQEYCCGQAFLQHLWLKK